MVIGSLLRPVPLFPKTATLQRLSWAGFLLQEYPFELVSTYEDFHFAKPQPAYFMEVMARIGWPEDGIVVVVGDNLERDILPAIKLGLPAFWVHSGSIADPVLFSQPMIETRVIGKCVALVGEAKGKSS